MRSAWAAFRSGASDYSTALYSYDRGSGRSRSEALQHRTTTATTSAHLRAALTANSRSVLFGSPWSLLDG